MYDSSAMFIKLNSFKSNIKIRGLLSGEKDPIVKDES